MSAAFMEEPGQDARTGLSRSAVLEWVATLLIVFALAWISKAYTRDASQIATVWLANGLLLGVMLAAPGNRWIALLVAGLVANIAAGFAVHDPLSAVLPGAFCNVAEVAIAAYPLRRAIADPTDLGRPRAFGNFVLFAMITGPAIAGLLLLGIVSIIGYPITLHTFRAWFIAHALGAATMAPTVLALRKGRLLSLMKPSTALQTILMVALLLGVTTLVFGQSRYPLLFLIFPPLLLVAMRTDFSATAAALLMVVLIGVWFTAQGLGPLGLISGADNIERLRLLQLYIAVLLMTLLPVVVGLMERRREQHQARILHARYQLLADHVSDVVVLTDVYGKRLYVSPAVEEVFGWAPEEFLTMSYRDMVHPDDLKYVSDAIHPRDPGWTRLTLVYRGRRRDGSEIWIEAQIARFRDTQIAELVASGMEVPAELLNSAEGRVTTLRDITRRRQTEQALEAANRELASLVWKDGLTGLANRRRFDECLRTEWARALRERQPLAVAIIDVDHFKIYNDRYGHQLGDHCLISVSDAIASGLYRPSDLAARYGGEEFGLILPGATMMTADKVARRIQESIMSQGIDHEGSVHGVVTVSVGVATVIPTAEGTAEDLLRAADEALYASKHAGRNRVTSTELL